MSDDPNNPVITSDRVDSQYTWEVDQIEIDENPWTMTEPDGRLVRDMQGLKRFLYDSEPNQDINDSFAHWLQSLTAMTVQAMPDELREEILDAGYSLPV